MNTTIQIIDDNVALTTLLAKTLSKFGYTPVVENNPLLAINTARHHLPDLILLDIMMPERDGGRVLADLRADLSLRYIPVVLLTGIAREVQGLANTGGITSVILSKPVQLKELLHTIEGQLSESRTYNEQQEFNAEQEAAIGLDAAHRSPAALPPLQSELPEREPGSAFSGEATPPVDFAFPKREENSSGVSPGGLDR
ncbi:MAG: response regulator [Verrucomicrobiales bacterium]|nr:response regulator [Verrucomicrobiales bacterium]